MRVQEQPCGLIALQLRVVGVEARFATARFLEIPAAVTAVCAFIWMGDTQAERSEASAGMEQKRPRHVVRRAKPAGAGRAPGEVKEFGALEVDVPVDVEAESSCSVDQVCSG